MPQDHSHRGKAELLRVVKSREILIDELNASHAALRSRLTAAEGLLRVMRESVNGLLMYEDDAIRDFAERRDPCPNVVTGPRKWLKRIREARAQIDAFLTGRAG